jgi:hypothetical protein
VLAIPGSFALAWWTPAPLGLAAAAAVLVGALAGRTARATAGAAACGAVLTAFAVTTSLVRPALTAWILAGVVVLGVAVAALAAGRRDDRKTLGGVSLVVALVAAAPAVGSALIAAHARPEWAARVMVAALVLDVAAAAVVRVYQMYAFTGLALAAVIWPGVAAFTPGESLSVYSGVSLLILAVALVPLPRLSIQEGAGALAVWAFVPGLLGLAVGAGPAVLGLVGSPYGWLQAIWTGRPQGTGLSVPGQATLGAPTAGAAVGVGLLALACAVAMYAVSRRIPVSLYGLGIGGPTAVLLGITAAKAPWPAVPAATLLIGVTLVLLAAITKVSAIRSAGAAGQGLLYVGAGLTGALALRWSTLTALGIIVAAAAVIGAVGRGVEWRVAAIFTSASAWLLLAATAGLAADLTVARAAFTVLGGAIVVLLGGALLFGTAPQRRRMEGRAAATVAHAGGLVALAMTTPNTTYAATVSVIWGVALGLRALLPGTRLPVRAQLAATAGAYEILAWWLLLFDHGVTLVEAYTLPLALVTLLAGWAALRARPDLTSWVAYGPGLAAAFGPSLAAVIGVAGDPWRRLGLGAGAIIVVVLGSVARLKAPVVLAGIVLAAVALHELVLLWQLLPGWIPLAAGGVILVALAITYERRLRDLNRLRTAIGRMS